MRLCEAAFVRSGSVVVSPVSPPFFADAGTFTASGEDDFKLVIRFAPADAGTFSAVLPVKLQNECAPWPIQLTGNGVP